MSRRYHLDYAARELKNRQGKYAISILGIAVAVALLISLSALAQAYREAARIPLQEIGADLVVQKYGNVPKAVSGPILSCAVGPVTQSEMVGIGKLSGVRELSPVLIIWVFDQDYFKIVTGIDPKSYLGKSMASQIAEGEFISQSHTAVVEKNFARMHGINLNDRIKIDRYNYTVTGILAAQKKDSIGATNILISLPDSQEMAYNAKNIQNTVSFKQNDVNMIFLRVGQDEMPAVKIQIEQMMGKNSRVSSMDSFLPQVTSVTAAAGRFSAITSLIAIIVASILLFKNSALGILERKAEIGVMKTVGWTEKDVRNQFMVESLALSAIGGILGVLLGGIAIFLLGMVDITIPLPADLLPDPFLASQMQKQVSLPISFPLSFALISFVLAVVLGLFTGILTSRKISSLKPAEVLKYE